MTSRYATTIGPIWTDEGYFERLTFAAEACAHASGGNNLRDAVKPITQLAREDPELWISAWHDLEAEFDHDIAAFVELIRRNLTGFAADQWHRGRTSSDLVETAIALQLKDSYTILHAGHENFLRDLARVARKHASRNIRGRTHGQTAEYTTVGRRFALVADGLAQTFPAIPCETKLSGPVGTDNRDHSDALRPLRLREVPSTQIVPRWHRNEFLLSLANYTTNISWLATMIRLGAQDSDQRWCQERPRTSEARGSSSMASKSNPIRSERAVGLCKQIRGQVHTLVEAGAEIWEERDISHSSVDRIGLGQVVELTDFVVRDMTRVVRELVVRTADFSGHVTDEGVLRDAVDAGHNREAVYRSIRDFGAEATANALHVEGKGRLYDPDCEPRLWEHLPH